MKLSLKNWVNIPRSNGIRLTGGQFLYKLPVSINRSFLSNFCTQKFAGVWGEEPQLIKRYKIKSIGVVSLFDAIARQCEMPAFAGIYLLHVKLS